MKLSSVAAIIAAEINQPVGRVKMYARRLQEIGAMPIGPGGRLAPELSYGDVSVLLVSLLIDQIAPMAARTAVKMCSYTHSDDTGSATAGHYIAQLLKGADLSYGTHSQFAFNTSVTVHSGDEDAIVIRHGCTDRPIELAFTADSKSYKPELAECIVFARTLPGVLLHRIGRALKVG